VSVRVRLFLAIVRAIGVVAVLMGAKALGVALVFAGVGSVLAAALALLVSSPDMPSYRGCRPYGLHSRGCVLERTARRRT
jgi:hypothetical protein